MNHKTFLMVIIAGAIGISLGGIVGSNLRGQNVNWFLVSLNVVLIVMALYFTLYKRRNNQGGSDVDKVPWEQRKKKKK